MPTLSDAEKKIALALVEDNKVDAHVDARSDTTCTTDSDSDSDSDTDSESESDSETVVSNNDLRRLLIVHDSTLKDIDASRLGLSNGLQVTKVCAYTIDDCLDAVGDHPADVILLHTGINDLKRQKVKTASRSMSGVIKTLSQNRPQCKIVVSKALATKRPKLNLKKELFNVTVHAKNFDAESTSNVSFIDHARIKAEQHLADDVHLNAHGTGIVAGQIGRHVASMFWKTQQRKQSPQRRQKQSMRGGQRAFSSQWKEDESSQPHPSRPPYHNRWRNQARRQVNSEGRNRDTYRGNNKSPPTHVQPREGENRHFPARRDYSNRTSRDGPNNDYPGRSSARGVNSHWRNYRTRGDYFSESNNSVPPSYQGRHAADRLQYRPSEDNYRQDSWASERRPYQHRSFDGDYY